MDQHAFQLVTDAHYRGRAQLIRETSDRDVRSFEAQGGSFSKVKGNFALQTGGNSAPTIRFMFTMPSSRRSVMEFCRHLCITVKSLKRRWDRMIASGQSS